MGRYETQPPARIMAFVTLVASTLDVLADVIMSIRLASRVNDMESSMARNAVYAYWFFTFVSIFVYFAELADTLHTLWHGQENLLYARIAKSMVIALEEVPIPICLLLIYVGAPSDALQKPTLLIGIIKLVALTWGILKFMKLKFCWFCLPCTLDHGFRENSRRCFKPTWYRAAMFIVNVCHVVAIGTCITIIIVSSAPQ